MYQIESLADKEHSSSVSNNIPYIYDIYIYISYIFIYLIIKRVYFFEEM